MQRVRAHCVGQHGNRPLCVSRIAEFHNAAALRCPILMLQDGRHLCHVSSPAVQAPCLTRLKDIVERMRAPTNRQKAKKGR